MEECADELSGPRAAGYLNLIKKSPAGRAGTPDEVGTVGALLMGPESVQDALAAQQKRARPRGFVKTVLTRDHAIANMQSRGAVLRSTRELHQVIRESGLRALGEEHFNAGVSRRRRNALLREQGYDPAGEAGEIYNAAYRAAQRAALEARWAALYDGAKRAGESGQQVVPAQSFSR